METNYTQEEQIEALKWLGAEIEVPVILACSKPECSGGRWKDGSPCGYCDEGIVSQIGIRLATKYCIMAFDDEESAHDFLRTDSSAWMAMDDELREHDGTKLSSDFGLFIYDFRGFKTLHKSTKSRSESVYSVFMQFIREELKSK